MASNWIIHGRNCADTVPSNIGTLGLEDRRYAELSWIRTKGDVSVACVFDVARIVNFVVIEHKMFLSGILVL